VRLRGFVPFGVVATTSMRHRTGQVIEPGAFGPPGRVAGEIFLLHGFDYANTLASSAAGSLDVAVTREGLRFQTAALPKTDIEERVRRMMRAKLIGGVIPGYVPLDVSESVDAAGRTITTVRRAMLCEINLVGRAPGDGSQVGRR